MVNTQQSSPPLNIEIQTLNFISSKLGKEIEKQEK